MPEGEVEGTEVVPLALNLGALGHPIAHAHEHVLQLLPGLGDDVEVAVGRLLGDLGEVEALGGQLLGSGGGGELGFPAGQDVVDGCFGGVQRLSGLSSGVGLEGAECLASRHERGALAGYCGPHRPQFVEGGRGLRLPFGLDHQLFRLSHRTPLWQPLPFNTASNGLGAVGQFSLRVESG